MTARTEDLAARLMRYCAIDSQSDADSPSQPSTTIQLTLANLLVEELKQIGAADVGHVDDARYAINAQVLSTVRDVDTGTTASTALPSL